ncbi:uncharacterized protein EMH_0044900 [Eimeria mitis]|uniref:Uncharacterized protein n=1 Tax=Eimeria mitis TaxID=44415 RepID=U6K4A7_9EIME|nr:uncharacterized protein EMH_0044900 [Eimeria mitis]CDJ32514.1 hypothetical protein EMH_0044900 [Eimeria mitis]
MLPSVSHVQRRGKRQNGAIPRISVPYTQNDEAEEPPIIPTPFGHQDARSRSRLRSRPLLLSLAACISVATFLVAFSVCIAWRNKKLASGAARRSLSEGGDAADQDELSVIEGCLALEAEMGVLEQRVITQSDADPMTRVEGLVSVLHAAAEEHEAMQGMLLPRYGLSAQHNTYDQIQQHVGEELTELQSMLQPHWGETGDTRTVTSLAASSSQLPLDTAQALEPQAWLEDIPYITSGQHQHGRMPFAPPTIVEFGDLQASTSYGMWKLPQDIRKHPYVRLPALAKDVVVKHVDVDNLFNPMRMKEQFHPPLVKLRKLFSKDVLSQDDADAVVRAIEELVGSAWYQARKSFRRRPVHAAETCGQHFLIFDALVSAFELLGDSMELPLWWGRFVAAFDGDPSARLPPVSDHAGGVRRRMIRRIQNALDIYKTGRRPLLQEVIALKKLLFCSSATPGSFNDKQWDPWREDGKYS